MVDEGHHLERMTPGRCDPFRIDIGDLAAAVLSDAEADVVDNHVHFVTGHPFHFVGWKPCNFAPFAALRHIGPVSYGNQWDGHRTFVKPALE